jgi:hypothetical protein
MTLLEWMKRYAFNKDTAKGYTTIKDLVKDYKKFIEKHY